jgi:hypothetical protein
MVTCAEEVPNTTFTVTVEPWAGIETPVVVPPIVIEFTERLV